MRKFSVPEALRLVLWAALFALGHGDTSLEDKSNRVRSCIKNYREHQEGRVQRIDGANGGNGKAKMGRLGPFLKKEDRDAIRSKIRNTGSKGRKFEQTDGMCKASKVDVKKAKAKSKCQGKGKGKKTDAECSYLALGDAPCSELDCRADCLDASKAEADSSMAVMRRMLAEGDDDDEFEDMEDNEDDQTDGASYAADLLAGQEWDNMCDSLEEDVSKGKTDRYVERISAPRPDPDRRRQLWDTTTYPQPNTPQFLKDIGVMTMDIKCGQNGDYPSLCRLGEAKYPPMSDWRQAEVTQMIDDEDFETWESKTTDPYYQNKKTSTEMGAKNTNQLRDLNWVNLALGTADDIAGSFEIAHGSISVFFGALVEWNPVQLATGVTKEAMNIHTKVVEAPGTDTGIHDVGYNSVEITAVHENAKVVIHNQAKSIDVQKAQQQETAQMLVSSAAENTQEILDLIDATKSNLIDKERVESLQTRENLTMEVVELRDKTLETIRLIKQYYEARINALESELCNLKAQQALMAEDQNVLRKLMLMPEGRRPMYNQNPKGNPPFPEMECVDPLAFFADTCGGRDPNGIAAAIRANAPAASCKPI